MNILCNICSEFLISDEDFVVTLCGHCFHRKCISDWIKNSRTCPTCRHQDVSPSSLIKVYVENDQNRLNDLHNELLRNNEKLSRDFEEIKEKARLQEAELLEINAKYRDVHDKYKKSQRIKQLDDMAIAGLKMVKDESTKEILKLTTQMNTLKLDLLAERQLRRIHQTTLQELDPKNENYDLKGIVIDEPSSEQISNYPITPFWKLSSEAAIVDPPKKDTSYIVPSKIQKANENLFCGSSKNLAQKRLSTKEADRVGSQISFKALISGDDQKNPLIAESNQPKAPFSFNFSSSSGISSLFRFGGSNDSSSSNPQPSTSSQSSSMGNKPSNFKSYRDNSEIATPRTSER